MKLNEVHFSSITVFTQFLDKGYQEINFKSHLDSVLLCQKGKILSDLHMSHVILFHFTCLCLLLQCDRKFIEIFWYLTINKEIMSGLNTSRGIISDFFSISLLGFTLVIRNFGFKDH